MGWLIQSNGADDEFAQLFHSTAAEFTAERCSDALLPANREKNRYANVLPYNFNRVRLDLARYAHDPSAAPPEVVNRLATSVEDADDDDEASDYINGTYLLGDFDGDEAATGDAAAKSCPYIATQVSSCFTLLFSLEDCCLFKQKCKIGSESKYAWIVLADGVATARAVHCDAGLAGGKRHDQIPPVLARRHGAN